MYLIKVFWWLMFVGSFFTSMSLFLSMISKEERPKEKLILSFVSGAVCIFTFLMGMFLGFV